MPIDLKQTVDEIRSRHGVNTVTLDQNDLRGILAHDLAQMEARGFDPGLIESHRSFNAVLDRFINHPVIGEYLTGATPEEIYLASGVRVLTLDAIRDEISDLAPGAELFPHGYLPFATSIGGNAICFDLNQDQVVWADHSAFFPELGRIEYFDTRSNQYFELPFGPDGIAKAVTRLQDHFWAFLDQLIRGRLASLLDDLD